MNKAPNYVNLTFNYTTWSAETNTRTKSVKKMQSIITKSIKDTLINGDNEEGVLELHIPYCHVWPASHIKVSFDDGCKFECVDISYLNSSKTYEVHCNGNIHVTVAL